MLDLTHLPRLPIAKKATYQQLKAAFHSLQTSIKALTLDEAIAADQEVLERLVAFWDALEDAQHELVDDGSNLLVDTITMDLRSHMETGTFYAYALLFSGNRLIEKAKESLCCTLDGIRRVGNEKSLWHAVKKRIAEYGDALLEAIRPVGLAGESDRHNNPYLSATPNRSTRPRWDEEARELWYGSQLLKKYKRNPATNQIDVIEAFQRAGWPRSIVDPFNNARKLSQTIRDLNNALTVKAIRFTGTGTTDVAWEPILP